MRFINIAKVEREPYVGCVHDLNVAGSHTYTADGFVVGNCSSGLHGVGVTCVNALSDHFEVTVKRDGAVHRQTFTKGVPTSPVTRIGDTTETGTTIVYHPDPSIFKITLLPSERVASRLAELASLNSGAHVHYVNEVDDVTRDYIYEDGIVGYTRRMLDGKRLLYDEPFAINDRHELPDGRLILVDVAFAHDDEVEPNGKVKTFANNVNTYEGGYHLLGFKSAYKDAVNQFGVDRGLTKAPIELKYMLDGLYATVSIKIPEAEFEGQTKTKLGNKEAQTAVEEVVLKAFKRFAKDEATAVALEAIVTRAAKVKEAEEAARAARALSRKVSKVVKTALPGKLADCSNQSGYKEIFITEGDSASGSAKEGRYREFQAVLSLRGKILNVSKADLDRILNSEVIRNIVASLGAGIGKTFKQDDVRYSKIIILCFTGDTRVKMLDGTLKTFKELAQMEIDNPGQTYWVYSVDKNGKVVPGRAKAPRMTRKTKKLARLTLDDGGVIESTVDHLYMLRDGSYVEAKDLKPGDSLMPLNVKLKSDEFGYNNGREMIYDQTTGKWVFTHQMVMDMIDGIGYQKGTHIHHLDCNHFNNSPDNLERWDAQRHREFHAKSEKHINKLKEMHKEGMYEHTYWSNSGWNGSQAQRNMLVVMNARPEIVEMHSKNIIKYNSSEQNSQSTAVINCREDVKIAQQRGRIIAVIASLLRLGNESTLGELLELKECVLKMPSATAIAKYFESGEELLRLAANYEKTSLTTDKFEKITTYNERAKAIKLGRSEQNVKTKQNSMASIGRKILDEGMEINAETYLSVKRRTSSRAPKWENINKYFESESDFVEYCRNYNHKVTNIEIIELDEAVDMYDITVEEHHNFFVSSTVNDSFIAVHNCDADTDGLVHLL